MAAGRSTALVLLDLSAAFDTIDHKILLNRLSTHFGLSGIVMNWFTSYLSTRSQKVKVDTILSTEKPLNCGVPQGSVLGPILFSLYTTPLSSIITVSSDLSHLLYADDTQIYVGVSHTNFSTSISQLQDCLSAVQTWMAENRLKLNPDKTEFILIGTKHNRDKLSSHFPLDILGNRVHPSNKVKNLGVIFNSDLSLTQHISSIVKSCYCNIRDLTRIRKYLSLSDAISLANALVGSRLDYCNSLLSSITKKELKRLQRIQNTVCRITSRIPRRASITNAMKKLHWLPVENRIKFKINTMTYKTIQTGQPVYLASDLHPYTCVHPTRRSNPDLKYLSVPKFDTKLYKFKNHANKSFAYVAPTSWNSLPTHVRTATSLNSFRSGLKTHLFSLTYPP